MIGTHLSVRTRLLAEVFLLKSVKDQERHARDHVDEILDFFGLSPYRDVKIVSLPYGFQKKVDLARALVLQPKLLLLDEPSLGLAPLIVKQIFNIIRKINNESKTTIFLVEQNANMALKVAHRGYVMETGRVTFSDTAENLMANDEVRRAYLGI